MGYDSNLALRRDKLEAGLAPEVAHQTCGAIWKHEEEW